MPALDTKIAKIAKTDELSSLKKTLVFRQGIAELGAGEKRGKSKIQAS